MTEIPLIGFDKKPQPPQKKNDNPKKKKKKNNKNQQITGQRVNNQHTSGQQSNSQRSSSPQNRDQNRRNNAQRHKKRRKKNYMLHYVLLSIIFIITFIILSFTVLFNIKEIIVTGNATLEPTEIITQSGILKGDNLLLIDKSKIEKKIMDKTYLLDNVTVKRKFPATVELNLEMSDATFGVKYGGMHYYFSETKRLIARTEENSKPEVIVFRGIELEKMNLGDYLNTKDEDALQISQEILTAIKNSKLTDISYVDMRDDVNVDIYYKNQIQIKVGTINNLDYKLESANRVITQKITDDQVGVLDVQTERKAYFRQKNIVMP